MLHATYHYHELLGIHCYDKIILVLLSIIKDLISRNVKNREIKTFEIHFTYISFFMNIFTDFFGITVKFIFFLQKGISNKNLNHRRLFHIRIMTEIS